MAAMSDMNAIGKVPPPKTAIRSIPKFSVPNLLRPKPEAQFFRFLIMQMTETGIFFVCDPAHLLPEESTPKGEFRCSYIGTG